MANNLSSIGLVFESEAYGERMLEALCGYPMRRDACVAGDYVVWRSGMGAELWYHLEGERNVFGRIDGGRVVGWRPFFAGDGEVSLQITQFCKRQGDTDFEGVMVGAVDIESQPMQHRTVLAFDAVDFARHAYRSLPIVARVKLVGFVSEMEILGQAHGSALALAMIDDDARLKCGVADNDNAPVAAYLNTVAGAREMPPSSLAQIIGTVKSYRRLENEVTDCGFHWALLEVPGGSIDVVADLSLFDDPLRPGELIGVMCDVAGRVID